MKSTGACSRLAHDKQWDTSDTRSLKRHYVLCISTVTFLADRSRERLRKYRLLTLPEFLPLPYFCDPWMT